MRNEVKVIEQESGALKLAPKESWGAYHEPKKGTNVRIIYVMSFKKNN